MSKLASKSPFCVCTQHISESSRTENTQVQRDSLFELLSPLMWPVPVTPPSTFNEPAEQTVNLRKDACESGCDKVHTRTHTHTSPPVHYYGSGEARHKDRWSRAAKWLNKYLSCFLLLLQSGRNSLATKLIQIIWTVHKRISKLSAGAQEGT